MEQEVTHKPKYIPLRLNADLVERVLAMQAREMHKNMYPVSLQSVLRKLVELGLNASEKK